MKLQGQHTYEVPRAVAWRALMDPSVLARTLPGCDELVADGDGRFRGAMNVKIGPVQGRFAGTVQMTDVTEPEAFHVHVHGDGAPGFMDGKGHVRLDAAGAATVLHYDLDVHVGGRVASVGQRLLDSTARAITRQALEGLGRQLDGFRDVGSGPAPGAMAAGAGDIALGRAAERAAPGDRPGEPSVREPGSRAPSHWTFAASVAREVAVDLVPAFRRPWLMAAFAAVVLLVAWAVWSMLF